MKNQIVNLDRCAMRNVETIEDGQKVSFSLESPSGSISYRITLGVSEVQQLVKAISANSKVE